MPLRILRFFCRASIPLGRIASVPVEIHTSSLLYPAGFLLCMAFTSEATQSHRLESALLLEGALVVLWLSLLVHEFAHVFAARCFGIGAERVMILPIGAVAILRTPVRDARELWIALAGPVASLGLAGLCWLGENRLALAPGPASHLPPALELGCIFNFIIATFNLLPCFPMDGGRVLRSLLALALGCFYRRQSEAFAQATHLVVRFVNPIIAVGVVGFTIFHSHAWTDLVLLAFLLMAGEAERSAQQEERESEPG